MPLNFCTHTCTCSVRHASNVIHVSCWPKHGTQRHFTKLIARMRWGGTMSKDWSDNASKMSDSASTCFCEDGSVLSSDDDLDSGIPPPMTPPLTQPLAAGGVKRERSRSPRRSSTDRSSCKTCSSIPAATAESRALQFDPIIVLEIKHWQQPILEVFEAARKVAADRGQTGPMIQESLGVGLGSCIFVHQARTFSNTMCVVIVCVFV